MSPEAFALPYGMRVPHALAEGATDVHRALWVRLRPWPPNCKKIPMLNSIIAEDQRPQQNSAKAADAQ